MTAVGTYLRRVVPWPVIASTVPVLALLLAAVRHWPYVMWPLQGAAVALLAGAVAWCFDEPAAAVVDTLPRSLAWRTLTRTLGAALLLLAWTITVAWTADAYFGHALGVTLQGCCAALAVIAYATLRRRAGHSTPARSIAAALVPVLVFIALVRPFPEALPVFPYTSLGPWQHSIRLWAALGLVSVGLLVVVLSEARLPDQSNSTKPA